MKVKRKNLKKILKKIYDSLNQIYSSQFRNTFFLFLYIICLIYSKLAWT